MGQAGIRKFVRAVIWVGVGVTALMVGIFVFAYLTDPMEWVGR